MKYREPEFAGFAILICFPSTAPIQFQNCHFVPNSDATSFHSSSVVGSCKKYVIIFQVTCEDLHTPKKPKTHKVPENKQLLSLACKYLSREEKDEEEDQIAQVWAKKLKVLDPRQRLFAEKAVNDILFEAALGNLNRNSVQINRATETTVSRPLSADSWASSTERGRVYATNCVSTPMPSPITQQDSPAWLHVQQEHEDSSTVQSLQDFYTSFQG